MLGNLIIRMPHAQINVGVLRLPVRHDRIRLGSPQTHVTAILYVEQYLFLPGLNKLMKLFAMHNTGMGIKKKKISLISR